MIVPVPHGLDPQLTDYLASLPSVQIKALDSVDPADLPRVFAVDADRPEAVFCGMAVALDSGDAASTLVAWKRSENPDEPGVYVSGLPGLSSGTSYALTLVILGSRERGGVVQEANGEVPS